jgi:hypothetical protein
LRELTFEFHQKKQLATLTVDVVKMTDQNISAIFKLLKAGRQSINQIIIGYYACTTPLNMSIILALTN